MARTSLKTPDTWRDLATHLEPGDQVIVTKDIGFEAIGFIGKGTILTVIDNALDERECMLWLYGANEQVRLAGPGKTDDPAWNRPAWVTST